MPVIYLDMKFCREMAEIASDPDYLSPRRPDTCRVAAVRDRVRAAWLVATGKADALVWPEENR